MTEQGPTEEERVLLTPDGKGKAAKREALSALVESARARHVREAVEGMGRGTQSEGDDIVEIGNTGVWVSRAALLDALGGQTLDESPGRV